MSLEAVSVAVIISVAFFGESIFGFGGGLISIPLLSLILGVRNAVTIVLIFQLFMGLLIWKSYKRIDWEAAKPMTLSMVIGTIAGTLLLSSVSVVFLELFLGISILVFLVKMIWFNGFTLGNKRSGIASAGAGLGGGLFTGLIGMGGPALIMYLSVATRQKLAMRATLIYLTFVASVVRVGISIPEHLFTAHLLHLALATLPCFLIAILLGQHIHEKINDKYYRLGIYIILAVSAILILRKI